MSLFSFSVEVLPEEESRKVGRQMHQYVKAHNGEPITFSRLTNIFGLENDERTRALYLAHIQRRRMYYQTRHLEERDFAL